MRYATPRKTIYDRLDRIEFHKPTITITATGPKYELRSDGKVTGVYCTREHAVQTVERLLK